MAADQWAFYKRMYLPTEQALTSQAMAPPPVDYLADQADQNVNQASRKQAIMLDREQSRYGYTEDPQAKAAADRQTALIEAAAKAGARNSTRKETADLALQRMDALSKIGQGIPAEAISSGLTAEAMKNSMKLQQKQSQDALVGMGFNIAGSLAGMGASAYGGGNQTQALSTKGGANYSPAMFQPNTNQRYQGLYATQEKLPA